MDLGGKLHHLWKRYYDDCDAVIFVWKLSEPTRTTTTTTTPTTDDTNDNDDSDVPPDVTYQQQDELLHQVRASIPDDIPFVVLVHISSNNDNDESAAVRGSHLLQPNVRYQTAPYVLPQYHNPMTALFAANAATGQGVKMALEWLIPLAIQQLRVRDDVMIMSRLDHHHNEVVKP